LPAELILQMKRGVAIKIRDSLKSPKEGTETS